MCLAFEHNLRRKYGQRRAAKLWRCRGPSSMRDSSKTPKLRSFSFLWLSVRHTKDLSPVRMSVWLAFSSYDGACWHHTLQSVSALVDMRMQVVRPDMPWVTNLSLSGSLFPSRGEARVNWNLLFDYQVSFPAFSAIAQMCGVSAQEAQMWVVSAHDGS